MRIAFDSQAFVLQPYGGISRYFSRLSKGLSDEDQDVCIFANAHRNYYLNELSEDLKDASFLNSYPRLSWRLFYFYSQMMSRYKIAKWKPDLVHETYYSRIRSSPKNCPTVLTVYDMIHEIFNKDLSIFDGTIKAKKSSIDRANKIICISESTRQDLLRIYEVDPAKVSVVHLGFELFRVSPNPSEALTELYKPFLLFVGIRSGYKNFLGLLRAVSTSTRLLQDFEIVAFGGGKFSTQELQSIHSLGFRADQVKHIEGGDDKLACLYQAATAFIYPSLYEGFGLPPLEAMSMGCPVVASKTSSMPEVLGDAACFFDPSSSEDIRRSIEQVVYSDAKSAELKELGKHQASLYSWRRCANETLKIYRECL
jgi:glycosyltransferase involved in cell wall biosynthesis